MCAKGVGRLYFIDGIINTDKYLQILEKSLIPTLLEAVASEESFIFQQDGAACHTSKKSLKRFADNNIPILERVASSPELLPIETL